MRKHHRLPIYAAGLFLSFHYALVVYINSSFLATIVSQKVIGLLYILGAILDIVILLNISEILKRISLKALFLFVAAIDLVATLGLAIFPSPTFAPIFFVLYDGCILTLLFCLDVFLENQSRDDHTGRIRSRYLTVLNTAILFSPLFAGFAVGPNSYWRAYLLSSFFLIGMICLAAAYISDIVEPPKSAMRVADNLRAFIREKDVRRIFLSNFLLQFFYAWMVVYMPVYLHEHLGFAWQTIGILFTLMLLPFVLFEIPVGRIADKVLGEKEILTAGFIIMAIFTFFIPFIPQWQLVIWAFVLFMTRVGASFVEVTTESYFFKHVNAKQSGFIGLFRLAEPFAFITGPIVAVITLMFLPFQYIFTVLALFMALGIVIGLRLRDTR